MLIDRTANRVGALQNSLWCERIQQSIYVALHSSRFSIDSHAAKSSIFPMTAWQLCNTYMPTTLRRRSTSSSTSRRSTAASSHVQRVSRSRCDRTLRQLQAAAIVSELRFLPFAEWEATVSDYDAALTRDHAIHSPCASIKGEARSRIRAAVYGGRSCPRRAARFIADC